MTNSARDELRRKFAEWLYDDGLYPGLAFECVTVPANAPTVLAALVEEHGLHEVLGMLGGESWNAHIHGPWCKPYCDIVALGWFFPVTTEGDSDD